jgi:hypothetical protein
MCAISLSEIQTQEPIACAPPQLFLAQSHFMAYGWHILVSGFEL